MSQSLHRLSTHKTLRNPGRFFGFLSAYTLATGVATVSGVAYLPRRLRKLMAGDAEDTGGRHLSAVISHLKLTRGVWPFPTAGAVISWVAWIVSVRLDEPLAGLCVAAVVIPGGSFLEELLLWRSRGKVKSAGDDSRAARMPATGRASDADLD